MRELSLPVHRLSLTVMPISRFEGQARGKNPRPLRIATESLPFRRVERLIGRKDRRCAGSYFGPMRGSLKGAIDHG